MKFWIGDDIDLPTNDFLIKPSRGQQPGRLLLPVESIFSLVLLYPSILALLLASWLFCTKDLFSLDLEICC